MLHLLLCLLETRFLDKVSFYLPLTGTELLYYGVTFAAGLTATVLTLRYAHNGYRMNKTAIK
ncbi:MAG: hypothetical protein IIU86_04245 [Oscillospiraceae bacterium]|nr:hypothetical protein [Oscillospiraceae bacterium]